MKRTVLVVLLCILLIPVLLCRYGPFQHLAKGEDWIPMVPSIDQLELFYWQKDGTSFMNVSVWFGNGGQNITSWGAPSIVNNSITVNAEIWQWTGPVYYLVTFHYHTYNLGNLTPGEHLFTFKVWNSPVKQTAFFIGDSNLVLETDKSIYKIGENITTTLTNLSNETVHWVGRYPGPWDIFTYPDDECVFAAWPCFCVFDIPAGENVTYTWNQSDQFTIDPVECGTYVVRDNQGWGLSVFFKIVDADIVVPYDHPTIQQAINNANEGDTIYVSAGTYHENLIVNKTVSLVGEDREATTINGHGIGTVVNVFADNVVLSGFTIANGWSYPNSGINLNHTEGGNITHNIITNNYVGISLNFSSHNTVTENVIVSNEWAGLKLRGSDDNSLSDNTMMLSRHGATLLFSIKNRILQNNITQNEYGIFLSNFCFENTILGNEMENNTFINLHLWFYSDNNTIRNNRLASSKYGIVLQTCGNNTVCDNDILDNAYFGISIEEPHSSCAIFHNNLINNEVQVAPSGKENIWDNGCEGNFWSDYNGTDSDANGIGDTPYIVSENNTDNYPLMSPYVKGDVNHDAIVDIFDAILLATAFDSNSGSPDWNPHCDLNEDGFVDIFDAIIIATNFGEDWSYP